MPVSDCRKSPVKPGFFVVCGGKKWYNVDKEKSKAVKEMLYKKGEIKRGVSEIVDTEMLVPKDHLLRKVDSAVDFEKIYEFVEDLYCKDNGRPSIDPVVLIKMVIIQHLFGITSLRKTAAEVQVNVAYRWFLGYSLLDETPHFSTISHNFKHRFNDETVSQIFNWILDEISNAGYLSPSAVFIDGTHIKANANNKKKIKKQIPVASKIYAEELFEEINADREEHGKNPLKEKEEIETKEVTESITDPESGLFVKGEHKRQFAYEAHTACDKNGFVLDVEVTPGNVHDSVAFDEVYDNVTEKYPEIETVVADSAYKTPHIAKKIFDDGRVLSTAYKRPMSKEGFFKPYEYVYDKYFDCYICPNNAPLKYSTTNRDGYREYKSDPNICKDCKFRNKCTHSMNMTKVVTRHLWADYIDKCEDIRHTPKYQELYKMRKEKIERVFADAKEKHAMRYTPYRGLTQVTNWAKLKFACLNLKKLALWKSKDNHNTNKYPIFTRFFIAIWKNYNSFKQNPIQAFARMGFIYSLKGSTKLPLNLYRIYYLIVTR